MYHSENRQEDFLVLSGDCILVVEGKERRLHAWDFVHCPAGTEHVFVGAGEVPCVLLAAGARRPHGQLRYPVSEVAQRTARQLRRIRPSRRGIRAVPHANRRRVPPPGSPRLGRVSPPLPVTRRPSIGRLRIAGVFPMPGTEAVRVDPSPSGGLFHTSRERPVCRRRVVPPSFRTICVVRRPLAALALLICLFSSGSSQGATPGWRSAAPIPLPRSEVAAAALGNEIVVVGGFLESGESSSDRRAHV